MMRFFLFLAAPVLLWSVNNEDDTFSKFFHDSVLRIDYLAGGTDTATCIYIQQMKKEPYYAGSRGNLIDNNNYGNFRYRLFDLASDRLIFSKGFSTLFHEWQTTAEAVEVKKIFYQVAVLPFPKERVRFIIDRRTREGEFEQLLSMEVDPDDYFIVKEKSPPYDHVCLLNSGEPAEKVDLVILPEGYTEGEMDKFIADVGRLTAALFSVSPFDKHKSDFNIYVVKVFSEESGTDIPGEHVYRNTAFNSSFYTFNTPRYLTTTDMKSVYDAASVVPCDYVYVLVNSDRYGGGGFYNDLAVCTSSHRQSPYVFIHEFGHAFAGLADEYYTSSVAYEKFYDLSVEPWEPNITTLVDFAGKWEDMVDHDTPVPTPRVRKYKDVTGVFEGGGYSAKGIYSPMMDCRMKSNETDGFCQVCSSAIVQTIERVTGKR